MSYEIYDSELLALRQGDTVNQALRCVTGITPESRATVIIFAQHTIRGQSYRNFYGSCRARRRKGKIGVPEKRHAGYRETAPDSC